MWSRTPDDLLEYFREEGHHASRDPETGEVVVRDNRGYATRVRFDARGLPNAVVQPSGAATEMFHDACGNLRWIKTPTGRTVEMDYDERGNAISIARPGLCRYDLRYDSNDRLIAVQFPDETSTRFVYDSSGNLIEFVDRTDARTRYQYRDTSLPEAVIDPLGRTIEIDMTQDGSRRALRYPDGTREVIIEAPEHQALFLKGRDGADIVQSFDLNDMLHGIWWSDDAWVGLEFDPNGQPLSGWNDVSSFENEFNCDGQLAREAHTRGEVTYEYDADGRLTRLTVAGSPPVEYEYDPDGQLSAIRDWEGGVNRLRYMPGGPLSTIELANGCRQEFGYGELGRERSVLLSDRNGGLIAAQKYDYDTCERLVLSEDLWEAGGRITARRRFAYDAESRLLSELDVDSDAVTSRYAYDRKGNLTRINGQEMDVGLLDEPRCVGSETITYDSLGNAVSIPTYLGRIRCRFAADSTLRSAETKGAQWHFEYDALSRRITKSDGHRTWKYLWAGNQLVAEEYQEGPEAHPVRRDYLYMPGAHVPFCFREDGRIYWLITDARHAARLVLTQRGTVAWYADYDPFGRIRSHSGSVRQPWRLEGQYEDEETGLYYNRARYYNPRTASYLSRDPFWYDGEASSYGYCLNDPWNRTDPLGALGCLIAAGARRLGKAASGLGAAVVSSVKNNKDRILGAVIGVGTFALSMAATAIVTAFLGPVAGILAGAMVDALVPALVRKMRGEDVCVPCILKDFGISAAVGLTTLGIGKLLPKAAPWGKKVASALPSRLRNAGAKIAQTMSKPLATINPKRLPLAKAILPVAERASISAASIAQDVGEEAAAHFVPIGLKKLWGKLGAPRGATPCPVPSPAR